MNETRLREGLPGAEPASADLERKYRERMATITRRRITGIERASHVFGLVVALGTAAWFVWLFLQHRADGRPVAMAGLAVGLAFTLGWSAFSIALLRGGTEDQRWHGVIRTQMVGLFTLALAGLMLWAGLAEPDPARGNQLILFGLVFWTTMGLPFYVAQMVKQNELSVRSDVLRLELALAEAAERREVRA